MTSRYSTVIFASPKISDQKLSSLKSSCAEALCLKIGSDISAEAADYFCDCAPVTRFHLMTSSVTGGTYIHTQTVTRMRADAAAFEALEPDEIFMFSHEGDSK